MQNPLEQLRQQMKPIVTAAGFMSFFISILILPTAIYSLQVMDRVMGTGSIDTLLWLTAIMLIMFVAAALLQTLRGIFLSRWVGWKANLLERRQCRFHIQTHH